ncbi:MAG TPA: LCP family protein, partial [Thermoleophilia bacterium]|nr:LCP family protein [Thermoleophilia bacterium]
MPRTDYRYLHRADTRVRRLGRALFSAVIPGAGQITAGARGRGFVMLGVVIALLAAVVVAGLQGVDQVASWVVQPPVLLGLLAFNFALLAFRLFAVIDAYRTEKAGGWMAAPSGAGSEREDDAPGLPSPASPRVPPPAFHGPGPLGPRILVGAALALVVLFTITPHALAGYYAYISHDLLTTVFADEETTTTSASLPTTTTTVAAATSTSSTAPASTTPRTSTTAHPETTPPIEVGDDRQLTILLIGSDAGYGRSGSRADSIMVATVDLETGEAALLGIPRNTGSIPLSAAAADALGMPIYTNLISSLYWDARSHTELAPEGGDSGAVVVRDSVSMLLGIPVDYYAVVDMGGFVDLVDAFGG